VRAVRDALGMSGPELAARMGVGRSTIVDIEHSEAHRTVKLETLERAADALGCEVVYFLVPRMSLEETVHAQARRKAGRHLDRVAHHSKLEDQELADDVAADQLDRFAADLIDKRGLWSLDAQ
jgi:predicted DNA-binding mobile mystery protein A